MMVSDDSLLPPQSAYVPVGGAECGLKKQNNCNSQAFADRTAVSKISKVRARTLQSQAVGEKPLI